ncbi:MAG: MFS transporter [Deltaproteobacteria bacterium RBG_13_47_9]|nr:MAG: MFS transporter [Deltaproteobacteria bacterium RBG_13_47_9]
MTPRSGRSKFFYGYMVTAAGFCIWMIGWGTYTPSFSVFFKPLLTEFGWSRAGASLAYSLSYMVQAVLAIMMGWLTDRLGPRAVVMMLGSFLGICYLLMSQVNTLWHFQVNYALIGGIGISTLNIPVMVTLSRWFIKKRGLMIGIVQAGMGVGGLIFPPLTGWLILAYGWRSAYVILGIITFIGIMTGGFFLRRDPNDIGQLPDGLSEKMQQEVKPLNPVAHSTSFSIWEAVHTSQFWMIAGLYGSFGFCRSTFLAHIPAHVQDLGFPLTDAANVLAVITGSSMFSRVVMGRVADIIGNRRAFMISFAATAVSLIWGLAANNLWELYLFALVFGFGWGNQAVLRYTIASEVFGLASLGLVMGTLGVAESSAATFGSFFAGYLFDTFGNYQLVFWMGIGVSIAGILSAWFLKPMDKRLE